MFEKVILVMGLFAFAKEAPKLIGDVLGVDSGKMKLGIGGKLAAGGLLGAAFMGTGFLRGGINNLTHGFHNIKDAKGGWNKFKAAVRTPFSMTGGAFSSAVRSGPGAFKANNFTEARKAYKEGFEGAMKARGVREAYLDYNHGVIGAMGAHIEDAAKKTGAWLGISGNVEGAKKKLDIYTEGFDFKKQLEELAMKKSTQAKLYDQQIEAMNQDAITKEKVETHMRNYYKSTIAQETGESDADYNRRIEEMVATNLDTAYSNALIQRAADIDKLKDAKNFEIMKEISTKLSDLQNPKNAEYAELATAFKTYLRKNANILNNVAELTSEGWDSVWNSINPMAMDASALHDFVDDMKRSVRYTSNHAELEKSKNDAAREYAEFIQKENKDK